MNTKKSPAFSVTVTECNPEDVKSGKSLTKDQLRTLPSDVQAAIIVELLKRRLTALM